MTAQKKDEETVDSVMRRFSCSQMLAPGRTVLEPHLRIFLSYVLKEPDWVTDPILGIVADSKDVLQVRIAGEQEGRSITLLRELCHETRLRNDLVRMAQRTELGRRDLEWLLSLPRVESSRR